MPPRLIFLPPLAATTKVPLGHACSSSVSFKIYVTVHRDWWNKFRNDGKRIEVWSDLPGGGRQRGEWGETAFVEQSRSTPLQSGSSTPLSDEGSFPFSLLSGIEDSSKNRAIPQAYNNDRKVTLIATFALPQTYSHYSYTFRVAGPGQRVEWLGNMGSNGTVVVGEPGNRVGFEETGNWSALGTSARKWDRPDTEAADEPVAIGSFKNVDMVGWAFGRNGFNQKVTSTEDTKGANLFVLHPRLDTAIASRPFTDPPSSIVVSSPGETTSIRSDGTIVTTANTVTIQDFYPFGLPSEVQNATAQEWETIDSPVDDGGFVFIKSNPPEGGNSLVPASVPASVAILPAVTNDTLPPTSVIQLPLPMVYQLQPHGHRSILYAPENNSIEVVDFASAELQEKENLALTVGRDGGELVVVPAFEIGKAIEEADKHAEDIWTVGILEPAVTSVSIEAGNHPAVASPTKDEEPAHVPESEVAEAEPEVEAEAEHEKDAGEVFALGSPTRDAIPLAPESTAGTEESEIIMTDVKEGPSAPEDPPTPAAYPPTESIVKLNEQLVSAPQHFWVAALKIALTWVHVLLGLWAVLLLPRGEPGKKEVDATPDEAEVKLVEVEAKEEAPAEVVTETEAKVETEAQAELPTAHATQSEEKESEEPEIISLDEVIGAPEPAEETKEPADDDDDDEEFTYPVEPVEPPTEQRKFGHSASKSILTPPMTPPHVTANLLVSPLSLVDAAARPTSPTDDGADELNIRTKLVFQLPPTSTGKFKLVLHHHDEHNEGGLDRLRVTVDRRVVSLGEKEGAVEALVRQVSAHSWLVDVDASSVQTRGKVEVAVV